MKSGFHLSIKFLLVHVLIVICCNTPMSGQKIIDSLMMELPKLREDTNKVKILNEISQHYSGTSDYDMAFSFADKAKQMAESLGYEEGLSMAYNNIGNLFIKKGSYPDALKNHLIALQIRKSIGDKKGIANSYNNIGVIYHKQGNYPEALKNHYASLKIKEYIGDIKGIANSYNNIGNIYQKQLKYPEALKNHFASLKIRESIGDKNGVAMSYINIGSIYKDQGKNSEALKNYFDGLKIKEALEDKEGIAEVFQKIGLVYFKLGDYPEALKNHFASLKIRETIGVKNGISESFTSIGDCYLKMNQVPEGIKWLKKGLSLSKEIGSKAQIKDVYLSLALADSLACNYKEALKNFKLFTLYKDSLLNEMNIEKLTQTAMQYEFNKIQLSDSLKKEQMRKRADMKLEKQKTYTYTGLGGFMLLLVFSYYIFQNNRRLYSEKEKSETLLLNILPEAVAEELKNRGSTEAKQYDEVSVLFTDFVNFTQTSEKLSPQQLVQELNECFTAFDKIIERNGLEKIKTIGDAYMAVCGLPSPDSQHAHKSVKAALEIREFIEERRKQERVFDIRIGINSGSVVAGIVGIKKFAYDIWGDTVNTAARMEQNSEAGKVNISESTYQLVKDEFTCFPRGSITAKGKDGLKMYFVEREIYNSENEHFENDPIKITNP